MNVEANFNIYVITTHRYILRQIEQLSNNTERRVLGTVHIVTHGDTTNMGLWAVARSDLPFTATILPKSIILIALPTFNYKLLFNFGLYVLSSVKLMKGHRPKSPVFV